MSKNKNIQKPVSVTPKVSQSYYDLIVIFALSLLLYANTLGNGYVLDDIVMVSQNKFTKMGIHGIGQILSNDSFMGYYGQNMLPGGRFRPLAQIFFALHYQFFGLNPLIGHLFNILCYGLLCILIYIVLKKLFALTPYALRLMPKKWYFSIPFITALLFTTHPLHTEVVANIKSLDEILSSLLAIASLYYVLKYLDKKNNQMLMLIGALFLLALLAKENAITFLLIIPLTVFVFRKTKMKTYLFFMTPLLISTAVYFFLRYKVMGFVFTNNVLETELLNNPFLNASSSEKYATIMLTWGKYLWLMLFPFNLTHDYYPKQIPIVNWGDLRAIVPFIIFLGLTVCTLINIFKKSIIKPQTSDFRLQTSIISYGVLFFMITFSIQSNLLFNIGSFMNERFVFLPLLGFCLSAAYLIHFIFQKYKINNSKILSSLLFTIVFLYSVRTISRNMVWKDEFTLFTTDVNLSSNSAKCNIAAARALLEKADAETDTLKKRNMLEKALFHARRGVEIHPAYLFGWKVTGNVYALMKDYKSSVIAFDNALKLHSESDEVFQNLQNIASLADNKGLHQEAAACYKTILKYKPGDKDYLYKYANQLSMCGRQDTALVILEKLAVDNPEFFDAYNLMGTIYIEKYNNIDKALFYFLKAFNIKSNDNSVLVNLGIAYGIKKDFKKSLEFMQRAIDLYPDDPVNYRNIAVTCRNMGDISTSNVFLRKADEVEKTKLIKK